MNEELILDAVEARVIGVLVEKSLTTPDQYPLTVNAATSGCNQKSNRNPVLDLADSQVQGALEKLMVRGYAGLVHAAGGRTDRYRHNLGEHLSIDKRQLALMATLLLRGPQTRGELRTHSQRMAKFDDQGAVADASQDLLQGGLIKRISPARGSRSERFVQLLSPDLHPLDEAPASATPSPESPATPGLAQRVTNLEETVRTLTEQLRDLKEQLGA